ncbi:MAG: hypothetical protein L0Y60_00320 [Beijerinckiaceae bacterium]|nr:hypothetical protein [Beijerinckiaceae bacterium]
MVHFGHKPNTDYFYLNASVTLGSASNGINPPAEPVTLKAGTFNATIPPGCFKGKGFGPFIFAGVVDGVRMAARIILTGAKRYAFHAVAHNASLKGTANPVPVTLGIGNDGGTAMVNAKFLPLGGQARLE